MDEWKEEKEEERPTNMIRDQYVSQLTSTDAVDVHLQSNLM